MQKCANRARSKIAKTRATELSILHPSVVHTCTAGKREVWHEVYKTHSKIRSSQKSNSSATTHTEADASVPRRLDRGAYVIPAIAKALYTVAVNIFPLKSAIQLSFVPFSTARSINDCGMHCTRRASCPVRSRRCLTNHNIEFGTKVGAVLSSQEMNSRPMV